MREIHYEETSKVNNEAKSNKRYNTCMGISYAGIVLAVIWLLFFINFCDFKQLHPENVVLFIFELLFWILPFVIFIVIFIVFRKIGKKSYVEYDYSFLSGEVRVAKVAKNSYRRGVIRFNTACINRIGKVDSASYKNFYNMPGVKKMKLTCNANPSEGCDFYFMFINHDGDNKLLTFDCSRVFISNVVSFCNARMVVDKDLR